MEDTSKKVPTTTDKKEGRGLDTFREWPPLDSLLMDFDRAMDAVRRRFWRSSVGRAGSDIEPFWHSEAHMALSPVVDILEKDNQYQITAELPGLDPEKIELKVANGMLTLKGEKSQEKEEKNENYRFSERRYGSFQRSFTLPAGVDPSKVEANFKNGVLTISLPKTAEAINSEKKIPIRTS